MHRFRGFSLLEIMLALVVVSIGISVLLTFSASNQRETASKSAGNDYSLLVNDLLEQFVYDVQTCNGISTQGVCASLKNVNELSATSYLSLHGVTLSNEQIATLKTKGIDVDTIKVTITATPSDTV